MVSLQNRNMKKHKGESRLSWQQISREGSSTAETNRLSDAIDIQGLSLYWIPLDLWRTEDVRSDFGNPPPPPLNRKKYSHIQQNTASTSHIDGKDSRPVSSNILGDPQTVSADADISRWQQH